MVVPHDRTIDPFSLARILVAFKANSRLALPETRSGGEKQVRVALLAQLGEPRVLCGEKQTPQLLLA